MVCTDTKKEEPGGISTFDSRSPEENLGASGHRLFRPLWAHFGIQQNQTT
jgi:hypothetical protein